MTDRPFVDFPQTDERAPRLAKRQGLPRELAPGTVLFDTLSVVEATAAAFKLTVDGLRGDDRHRQYTEARGVAYWLLLRHSRLSLCEIARVLGKKDHTTVTWGVARTEQRRDSDSWFRDHIDRLERDLEAKAKGTVAA